MGSAFLSAREMMARMKTDEWLSVIVAVESGELLAHEKGNWTFSAGPGWVTPTEKKKIWQPSPFGTKTRQIPPENIRSIPIDRVVFLREDVEAFKTEDDSAPLNNVTLAQHQKLKNNYEKMKARLETAYNVSLDMGITVAANFEETGAKISRDDFIKLGSITCFYQSSEYDIRG